MHIKRGTTDDLEAVVNYWNSLIGNPQSAWQFSPPVTIADIEERLDHNFALWIALEGKELIGIGIWRTNQLTGVSAKNKKAFYRLFKEWATENPHTVGVLEMPALETDELTWLQIVEGYKPQFIPHGYKALQPGEDVANRKLWTWRVLFDLDALKLAFDRVVRD